MTKNYNMYKSGVNFDILGKAIENGETFIGMVNRIKINSVGRGGTTVERTQTCNVTNDFIRDNFEKLLKLKIIREI